MKKHTDLSGNFHVDGFSEFSEKVVFYKQIRSNDLTESNGLDQGAAVFSGGISIGKNSNIGGNMTVLGNLTSHQDLQIDKNAKINGAENATNKDHGALTVEQGGLGVEQDIVSGGNIRTNANAIIDQNLNVASISNLNTLNVAGNTAAAGSVLINNTSFSSTPLQGALVVKGGAGIGQNLNVSQHLNVGQNATVGGLLTTNNLAITNQMQVNGTDDAVDQNSGALVVKDGGLGVEKNIYSGKDITAVNNITANNNLAALQNANVGQNLNVGAKTTTGSLNVGGNTLIGGVASVTSDAQSNSPLTGALVVKGGAGIGQNLNVSQHLNVGQNATVGGLLTTNNLAITNQMQVKGTDDAVDQNSGALVVKDGGLGVEKNIYSGKDITAVNNITANNNLAALQNANVGQNLNVGAKTTTGSLNVGGNTLIGGVASFTSDAQSNSPLTGALVVKGGAGIGQNLNVSQHLNVGQNATVGGLLTTNNLAVTNQMQVKGTDDAVDQNSGALVVKDGGLGVEKNIYSGKDITAVNNITANNNLAALQNANVGQNLNIGAKTTTGSLNVGGNTLIGGVASVTSDAQSNSPLTGALVVKGGAGIGQNLNVSQHLNVGQNATVGGLLTTNNLAVTNQMQVNGTDDAVDQNSGALVVKDGGLGVEKNIYSGKDIMAVNNITANNNLAALQSANVGQNLNVGAKTTTGSLNVNSTASIAGAVDLAGITHISNAAHSTDTASGALVVAGGMGLAENLNIGQDLNVTKDTNLNGKLFTNKVSTFNDDAMFNKQVSVNSSTDYDNSKAFEVKGGAIIGKRLHIKSTLSQPYGDFTNAALKVDGGAIINGNLSVLGQVFTQNATINTLTPMSVDTYTYFKNPYQKPLLNNMGFGPDSSFNSYALRVNAVDQGIAIKVNKHAESNYGNAYGAEDSQKATTGNNFISFWNKDGMMLGRIEGESLPEIINFKKDYLRTVKDRDTEIAKEANIAVFKGIEVLLQAYEKGKAKKSTETAAGLKLVTGSNSAGPLVNGEAPVAAAAQMQKAGIEDLAAAQILDKVAAYETDLALGGVKIDAYNEQMDYIKSVAGVKYSSSAGDYAEYLELSDYSDAQHIIPAQIVGVKGGKISLDTKNCEKIMVVSMNPAVVGKEPAPEKRQRFKPVAFMGQVPVFVLNEANIGDYILPSGNNDGYAIAKSPENMELDDYRNIVGIAWEQTNISKTVNVVVGINTNDIVAVMKQQKNRIDDLESRIARIEKYMAGSEKGSKLPEVKVSVGSARHPDASAVQTISQVLKKDTEVQKIIVKLAHELKLAHIDLLNIKIYMWKMQ